MASEARSRVGRGRERGATRTAAGREVAEAKVQEGQRG